jgi:hypothetical protein
VLDKPRPCLPDQSLVAVYTFQVPILSMLQRSSISLPLLTELLLNILPVCPNNPYPLTPAKIFLTSVHVSQNSCAWQWISLVCMTKVMVAGVIFQIRQGSNQGLFLMRGFQALCRVSKVMSSSCSHPSPVKPLSSVSKKSISDTSSECSASRVWRREKPNIWRPESCASTRPSV